MTREPDYKMDTLQTAGERAGDTVPREVADRLAEELQGIADMDDGMEAWAPLRAQLALDEYRKAVKS